MLAGTDSGQVLVCDPRKGYSVQQRLIAHPCMLMCDLVAHGGVEELSHVS